MLYRLGEAINNIVSDSSKPKLISLAEQFEHFKLNPADILPPVGCNLVIIVDGHEVTAKRTGYIANRGDMLEYQLLDGSLISGRFSWRYL